ncbi:MAG: hypothetical protein ACPGU3_00435 [Litorivicinus sp.]
MLDRAADRYGDNHPITEALQRQYQRGLAEQEKTAETALTD